MRYYNDYPDYSWGSILLSLILCIVLLMVSSCSNDSHISSEREDANMVYIREGYCYDSNTKIIYRETIVDGYGMSNDTPTWSPYINENGNYCKYEYGKWVEFIKTP